jgi:hypothetical protein
LTEYRENLTEIVDVAQRHGVRLVFVTQPTIWRSNLPEGMRALLWLGGEGRFQVKSDRTYYTVEVLADVVEQYNGVLRELSEERGVECVDLAAEFPKDTTVFYDDCHFNENGARVVAKVLAEYFMSQEPLDRYVRK